MRLERGNVVAIGVREDLRDDLTKRFNHLLVWPERRPR
jgi:hypothetical protein